MTETARLVLAIDSTQVLAGERQLQRLAVQADRTETSTDSLTRATDQAAAGFGRMGAAIGSVIAALTIRQISDYADAWVDLNARVRLAVGPLDDATDVMERLDGIARRSYSSLQTTSEAYLLNSRSLRELGFSTQQSLDFTESLSLALVVSGAKAQRAESVTNALSKAIADGTLRGENFNTVIQQGGFVAEALADGLGISLIEIKKWAAEGRLTTERVVPALIGQLDLLQEKAESMEGTVADSWGRINDAASKFFGTLTQGTGVYSATADGLMSVADGLSFAADNMDVLVPMVETLAVVAGGRAVAALGAYATAQAKSTIAGVEAARADAVAAQQAARRTAAELAAAQAIYQRALADMKAVAGTNAHAHAMDNLAAAEMRAGQARAAHTAALNASTAAMARASVGARAAAGALALLGGPIGATITALAAAGYAIHTFTEGQRNARREVDEFRKSLDQAAPSLDSLIEKYREVNEVQREGLRIEWVRQQEVAAKAAEAAFVDMLNSVALETKGWSGVMKAIALDGPISGVRGLRAEFGELVAPLQEAFESGENLLPVIERIGEQEGLTSRQIDDLKQFAVEIDSARQKGEHFEELLSRLANEAPALTITPAAGDGGAGEAAASATEQFLKLESAFHQQIALYGQAGEAAKIRYQIESGALDDLLPKEREHLLALAEQYDAIVRIADAEEERQRATAAIDQRVAALQLEADTLGMTAAQAELYKLHLDGATEAQYRAAEAALYAIEMQDELATRRAEEAAYLNQLQGRLEGLENRYATETEQLEDKLLTERQILLESYEAQLIDREEYQALLTQANEAYYEGVDAVRQRDVQREQQANQAIGAARMAAFQSGIALLQVFARESETAGKLVLVAQTAISMAQAWQNTLVAQTAAMRDVPYPMNLGVAAKIGMWGKVQLGLIAATGVANLSAGGGGVGAISGGGGGGFGGGGYADPPSPLPPQEYQPGGGVTIIIEGDVNGFNIDEVTDAMFDKAADRVNTKDAIFISPNSRNGRMLSGR